MKLELIQDWTDYNKSLLCSHDYYTDNGNKIYQLDHPYPIPNLLTNSQAHASSLFEILQANIPNYPPDHKITILDIGSGQGLFARELLIAAKESGLLDRIEIIVSDISVKALEDIAQSKILDEFTGHYQLMELDAFNPPTSLKDISMITMNYVYDALEMQPLRYQDDQFQKMQVKLLRPVDLEPGPFPLQTLVMESRWQDYKAESPNEKKYFKHLNQDPEQLYSYQAIAITEKLASLLDEHGFIFVAEMLEAKSPDLCFDLYGNCCAHETNELLIIRAMEAQGMEALLAKDSQLMRIFFFQNAEIKARLKDILYKEFNGITRTDKFLKSIQQKEL
ncbi:MAG: class I SAM-dependent methyltransferase [Cyanobacteria bacterium]|nr:class I SAM-dependent methyltransferase [Cyanobacteriota bacterium]MDA1020247.1 class I SAM-dependent methyltransferase [Cyanobacteriota bacterium]